MTEELNNSPTILELRPIACGIDIVEIARIERSISSLGEVFLSQVYTDEEIALCQGNIPRFAGHFAGKEAVVKVLGTGFRGIACKEIALARDEAGRPTIALYGRAATRADLLGLRNWSVSLSYSSLVAIACVVATQ
jgi:holo-[acyl-carrier protein] synthase